jgi:hypothetical protein
MILSGLNLFSPFLARLMCRNNPENWANNSLPQGGSVVSFPDSFSEFGIDQCLVYPSSDCIHGGSVTVKAESDTEVTEVFAQMLVFPLNGQIRLESNTRMVFAEAKVDATPPPSVWAERGEYQFDFKCAANWVVTGTNNNPSFAFPCFQDVAVFNEVVILAVSGASHLVHSRS